MIGFTELELVEGLLTCTDYWVIFYSLFLLCSALCVFVWPWAVSCELRVLKAAKPLENFPSSVCFVLEFI